MRKDNFEFWCPLDEFNKAVDKTTGEEIMLLGGIASTADEDSDGVFLDPKGFDIRPLLKSGLVNWHHQAKTNPGTIVGEPTKAEIRKNGLYIETKLYPHSQVACDIWELAKTLASDSKTRRLGYSIEGRVVERKSEDPTNPDYKKIVKAVITGVAITHQPKNPKTFANIIKGEIEDDELDEEISSKDENSSDEKNNEDKAIDTDTAAALKKEHVDDDLKVTTFGKAEVFDKLFEDIPGISIKKAKEIYNLIEKIAHMKKVKEITSDDIEKAYQTLGIEMPEEFYKADDEDSEDEYDDSEDEDSEDEYDDSEDEEDSEDVKKAEDTDDDSEDDEVEDEDDSEDEYDDSEDKEDSDDEDSEDDEKEVKKADICRLEKAITFSHNSQSKYVKALGVIVKAQSNQLEKAQRSLDDAIRIINDQNDIIKSYEERFDSIDMQMAELGSSVPAAKSIRHAAPIERSFGKANDDNLGSRRASQNQVSISNRTAVAEILDQATFAKGFDEEFSKACTAFEAGAELPNSIIGRLKNEFNIEIVR